MNRPAGVDLQDAVAQAIQDLALAIKASGARVTVDRLPIVRGKLIPLVRLFQNLIGNAVKYGREDRVEIHVTAGRRGPGWVIRIEDNGLGIGPENQARVFMPFVRLVNRDVPGTGLGLAVCNKIVEGQGGAIWVAVRRRLAFHRCEPCIRTHANRETTEKRCDRQDQVLNT
jgi:signal transduction histidine kinase